MGLGVVRQNVMGTIVAESRRCGKRFSAGGHHTVIGGK